jgi:tRNA threonylcarbamoyladenosine biosynthesis protein TsaE
VPVSHLDLYRLRDAPGDPEDLVLLEDELAPDRLVFVEWPEALAADALGREPALRVVLRHAGGDRREVELHRG